MDDAPSSRSKALMLRDTSILKCHGKSAEGLEALILKNISDVFYWGGALVRRELVETLPKIGKIQVYHDHNPPHFHVESPDYNLMIDFKRCTVLKGSTLTSSQIKNLQQWYFNAGGQRLVCILWNKWNPDKQIEVLGEDTAFKLT